MKVLVTGGAGFIGSHVVDLLLAEGHEVVVLDDLSYGKRENLGPGARLVVGDIRDSDLVSATLGEGFDAICHLAAQKSVTGSMRDPIHDAEVNVIGTLNLLQGAVAHGVKSFVFASTGGALYGETDLRPTREDHPTCPESPYGLSKLAAETYLDHFARAHGLKAITLRLANVYGPRQDAAGEGGVVAIFSQRSLTGEKISIYGDGDQTRDYVYVGDVARAFFCALRAEAATTVNIGTGQELSVNGLADAIERLSGQTFEREHLPARDGEIRCSSLAIGRGLRDLGWSPQTTLEQGLRATIDAFA